MPQNQYLIPAAIVIAGLLLGITIYMVRIAENPLRLPEADASAVRPVTPDDHIVGNPEAVVTVIEYSDIDCAYCKQFHDVMRQIVVDYGDTGSVAWVYRHFPVIESHPNAAAHAEAAECVATLGGNTAFWQFIDAIHAEAPGDAEFNPSGYPDLVAGLGLSSDAFSTCVAGKDGEERVAADYDNAIAMGAAGAPFTVVVIKGADPIAISGAVSYDAMKKVIETALSRVSN